MIVDDFRFRFARTNKNGSIYYKCRQKATKKECSASITLKSENLEDGLVSKNLVHIGHTSVNSKLDLDVREFKKAMKELAKSNSTVPLQQLFQQEQARIASKYSVEELASVLPAFDKMKTTLYRKRGEEIPNLPVSSSTKKNIS